MDVLKYIHKDNKYIQVIATLGLIAVAGISIINAINVWPNIVTPKVIIASVNFEDGYALLNIKGKPMELYGDSTVSAGGDWGVRFGVTNRQNPEYDTVELVKNGIVKQILTKKAF